MFYIYVLISKKDNKFYVGYTDDLKRRIGQHNNGYVESTKHRRPLKLIYYEAYLNEKDARSRESFLKSGKGREIIKKQIKNSFSEKS